MVNKVIESVCAYFSVSKDDLLIKRSNDKISDARMFAIYILHCRHKKSVSFIAREFDILRSSVFSIVRKAKHRISIYSDDKDTCDAIISLINSKD